MTESQREKGAFVVAQGFKMITQCIEEISATVCQAYVEPGGRQAYQIVERGLRAERAYSHPAVGHCLGAWTRWVVHRCDGTCGVLAGKLHHELRNVAVQFKITARRAV